MESNQQMYRNQARRSANLVHSWPLSRQEWRRIGWQSVHTHTHTNSNASTHRVSLCDSVSGGVTRCWERLTPPPYESREAPVPVHSSPIWSRPVRDIHTVKDGCGSALEGRCDASGDSRSLTLNGLSHRSHNQLGIPTPINTSCPASRL